MAKGKKKRPPRAHQTRSVMDRSDIPMKHRLLLRQYTTVAEQRNDAAATALKLACVALNNSLGIGYTKLTRFADAFQKATDEYYDEDDREISEAHLNERLEKMGFVVKDGHVFTVQDDDGNIAPKSFLTEKLARAEAAENG